MAQITSGIRSLLASPRIYEAVQNLFGNPAFYREFVSLTLGATGGERVLDVGSGTSDILSYLPQDVEYVGVEPHAPYHRAAQARFGARGRFICGVLDETLARALGSFDIVILASVLHHLDDAEAARLLATLGAHSVADGMLATVDPVFVRGQSAVARLLISLDRGRNVRHVPGYRALAEAEFRIVEGRVRHQSLPPYSNFIMTCRDPVRTGK